MSLNYLYTQIEQAITGLEYGRFSVNPSGVQITNLHSDQTLGATWASTRVLDVAFQFASHNVARSFFNQGGSTRLIASLASGSNVGFEWYQLIHNNSIDTNGIILDYKGTKVGTGFNGAYYNGTASIGFYDLTTSFQTLYSVNRGGAYGTGSFVVTAKYDSATALLTIRLSFNEDFAAGQSINKLTVTTDSRSSVSNVSGAPHIDTPTIAIPTVTTSGTFLTAAAGT